MVLIMADSDIYEFDDRITQYELNKEIEELKMYYAAVGPIGDLPPHLQKERVCKMDFELPQGWLSGTLMPEYKSYKVDGSTRVAIPSSLLAKMGVAIGDHMEYYTAYIDGKWFLCMTKKEETGNEKES